MKAIAFHLQKGGVGKTTLTVSVAWELANMGFRTVVIDCDPQGNSSSWLLEGMDAEPEHELADVLLGSVSAERATVPVEENLWCMPTFGLANTLANYGKSGIASEPYVIADLVESLPFDYALLDMGPGLGAIEQAALLATSEVVLTITPEYFALDGLATWAARVEQIERGLRAKITYHRLVVNGLDRRIDQMVEVHRQAERAARTVYTLVTEPAFRKAQSLHVPAQRLDRGGLKEHNRKTLRRIAEDLKYGTGTE